MFTRYDIITWAVGTSAGTAIMYFVLLQLVLSVATADMAVQNSNSTLLLPSTTHVINLADSHDRAAFTAVSQMKEEPMDVDGYDSGSLDVNLLINIIVVIDILFAISMGKDSPF